MLDRFKTTVVGCARCGGVHYDLEFKLLTFPMEDSSGLVWTHWALCPTNGEPILLRIQVDESIAETG